MVISVAARAAAKIAASVAKKKWAKKHPEKVKAAHKRYYVKREVQKKVAKSTVKKSDYFIRKSPLPTTPGSVFTHGKWVHELPVKKLRHVRRGTTAPPMRDLSPKQDIHKTKYHGNTNIASNPTHPYWDSFKLPKHRYDIVRQKLVPDKIQTKKTKAMTPGESARKSWWSEFLKQSRAGKHLGVAGAAGGLGAYAASKKGKK